MSKKRCICQNIRITRKQIARLLSGDEVSLPVDEGEEGCEITLVLKEVK